MTRTTEQVLSSAEQELGPASASALARNEALTLELAEFDNVSTGASDLLLRWAFAASKDDAAIRDEFVASLLPDLKHYAEANLRRPNPRGGEREDLVQSMLGEALPTLFEASFNSRRQFLRFLEQRLEWKSVDRARHDGALVRGGRYRFESGSSIDRTLSPRHGPLSELENEEDRDRLAFRVASLPERLRFVLMEGLQGRCREELAKELDVSPRTISEMQRQARNALGHSR